VTAPPLPLAGLPGGWTFYADGAVPPFAPIGQVTVTSFTCSWVLSGFGSAEAVIVAGETGMSRDLLLALWGWRLWAFYQGQPVWAGFPVGITDDGGAAVRVALTELPGYLAKKQYATNHTYAAVEQTSIAADLAAPLANVGVGVVTVPGAGFVRDRTYTYLQSTRDQLLTELAQVINGPEFRSEYALDGSGNPTCTLRIAYPRVGASSGLALVVPGGAASFTLTWAADQMRTRTFAVGTTPPNSPTTATNPVVVVSQPQTGVPELDAADDWSGVSSVSTLTENANASAATYAAPTLALEAVNPASAPALGTYAIGDDVSVALADPLLPTGLVSTGRLGAASLDAAAGTVTWEVAVTFPPPSHLTLSKRIGKLTRTIATSLHHSLQAPPGGINP
jgi:hypothetical protein